MPAPKDRRREIRQMCSDLVTILFEDQTGRRVSERGLVEDVSSAGFCVSLGIPVPVGSTVEITTQGFSGKATVCYCNVGEYSYLLGLEFCDGYQWDRHKWRPKHLLSLPKPE